MMIKRNKFRIVTGFTFIELLVVISIIGILASIAVPTYRDYILRAKLSGALQLMSPLKTASMSAALDDEQDEEINPLVNPSDYVQCISVTRYNNPDCNKIYIEAWPNKNFSADVTPGITRLVVLEGDVDSTGSIKWRCGPYPLETNRSVLAALPSTCRDNITATRGDICTSDVTRVENVACRIALDSGTGPLPTPDPIPELDPIPEPDPVPEPTPDPDPEPDPVPEPTPIPIPEPDPDPEPDPILEPDPVPSMDDCKDLKGRERSNCRKAVRKAIAEARAASRAAKKK